jgi:Heterokaryon incompatibility protein (HET)
MATPALPPAEEVHLSIPNDECLPPLETSTSIRLIDLELGEEDSDIIMSIDTYNLPDPPQYAALSYTWGNPLVYPYVAERPSRTVWIDKKPFLVTPNLYDALNHWRGWKLEIGTANTLLWIDAICINQDDLLERNHQVGLMGQIYSKAILVMTWVGTSDQAAWTAFKLISRLKPIVELWQSKEFKFAYFHNSDELFERTGVSTVTPEEWEALISFYERQYFSRAWIVQEIVLAKGALLMLGHNFIHWNDLINLSGMMVNFKWIPILERYARPSMNAERLRLTLGAPAVYKYIRSLCKQYGPSELGQLQDSTTHSDARTFYLLLELLLYETRYFRATDPRDNIYAVLSIVSHAFGATYPTTDLSRPDYRLPVRKVFINVTREIATKTGSVSVLSLVDRDSKQIPDLPSWVPDYSASTIQALAYICEAGLYRAFDLNRRSPKLTIVDDVFSLCAIRWDAIAKVEHPEGPFALQGKMDLCLQLPKIYFHGQTRVEALWRTLIADTDGGQSPAPETIGNSFRQYVLLAVATRIRKILEGWDGRELEVPDFVSLIKLNNNYEERPDPWLPRGEEVESFWNMFQTMQQSLQENERLLRGLGQGAHLYAAAIESIGRGRDLFKTGGNLLGLAPVSAKPGDTIWFFPSSKVPFVLRHCGDKQYKLIGEAYLHGYMHGELEKFSMPLQYISLV